MRAPDPEEMIGDIAACPSQDICRCRADDVQPTQCSIPSTSPSEPCMPLTPRRWGTQSPDLEHLTLWQSATGTCCIWQMSGRWRKLHDAALRGLFQIVSEPAKGSDAGRLPPLRLAPVGASAGNSRHHLPFVTGLGYTLQLTKSFNHHILPEYVCSM